MLSAGVDPARLPAPLAFIFVRARTRQIDGDQEISIFSSSGISCGVAGARLGESPHLIPATDRVNLVSVIDPSGLNVRIPHAIQTSSKGTAQIDTVTADDNRDFYVALLTHSGAIGSDWVVYHGVPGSLSHRCVGVYGDRETATAQAIQMAEYHSSIGHPAQVHAPGSTPGAWRTVWHTANTIPRYTDESSRS